VTVPIPYLVHQLHCYQQEQQQWGLYEEHMALLQQQQQQQQQQGCYDSDAAQLADLQGLPLAGSLGTETLLSDDAILGLQAQVGSSPVAYHQL